MTEEQAEVLTGIVVAAYPVPEWPSQSQLLFAEMIGDLDYPAASQAARTWIMTRRERPTIADIRDLATKQLAAAGAIPRELSDDEAWGYVVEQMRLTGRYRPFPADRHPEVAAVVARLGWETLCASDNPEADRAHFLRLYAMERGRRREERNTQPGLRLPADAERIAAQSGSPALDHRATPALPAPTPEQREEGRRSIAGIVAQLTGGHRPTPAPDPMRRPKPVEFVEPTQADLDAAERRKAELLAALTDREGAKSAA